MTENTIFLSLLGTLFAVECADFEYRELIHELWSPFDARPDQPDFTLVISRRWGKWAIRGGEERNFRTEDPWAIANELRRRLVKRSLLCAEGLVALHAAAVARNGEALVLPGPHGRGKTTLTLALLDAGWAYLTDDVTVVLPSSQRVRPYPKPLGVKDLRDWARYGTDVDEDKWSPRPGSMFFVPARRFQVELMPVRIRWIAFPSYQVGAEPELEWLSPARGAIECGENSAIGLEGAALRCFSELSQKVQIARLRYGSTGQGLDLIEELVASAPKTLVD